MEHQRPGEERSGLRALREYFREYFREYPENEVVP
jgi:hypothetical protein